MRSVIYKIIDGSNIDPSTKKEALEEITRLEDQEKVNIDTDNLSFAFDWEDSDIEADVWEEISQEIEYADLEYRNDDDIDFSHLED